MTTAEIMYDIIGRFMEEDRIDNSRNYYSHVVKFMREDRRDNIKNYIWYYWSLFVKKTEVTTG